MGRFSSYIWVVSQTSPTDLYEGCVRELMAHSIHDDEQMRRASEKGKVISLAILQLELLRLIKISNFFGIIGPQDKRQQQIYTRVLTIWGGVRAVGDDVTVKLQECPIWQQGQRKIWDFGK